MRKALALGAMIIIAHTTAASAGSTLAIDSWDRTIDITIGFTGTNLMVFGTNDRADADIIVVVRGPPITATVLRKRQVGGIWTNSDRVQFNDVPSFYAVAATRPLSEIAPASLLNRREIGVERIRFPLVADAEAEGFEPFRDGLVHSKEHEKLYLPNVQPISRVSSNLFRTQIALPAAAPMGDYKMNVFELVHGFVVKSQSTTIQVRKAGEVEKIYRFAMEHPAWNGMCAVFVALTAGWAASLYSRRT